MRLKLTFLFVFLSFYSFSQEWTSGEAMSSQGNLQKWAGVIGSGNDYVLNKPQLMLSTLGSDRFFIYIADGPAANCSNKQATINIGGTTKSFVVNCSTNKDQNIWIFRFPTYDEGLSFIDGLMVGSEVDIKLTSDCTVYNAKFRLEKADENINAQLGGIIQEVKDRIGYQP